MLGYGGLGRYDAHHRGRAGPRFEANLIELLFASAALPGQSLEGAECRLAVFENDDTEQILQSVIDMRIRLDVEEDVTGGGVGEECAAVTSRLLPDLS